MDEAMCIGFEAMPLNEEITGGQRTGQPCVKCSPGPLRDFLQMTDAMNHREYRLPQQPSMPETALTQVEIRGLPLFGMERGITQDDPLFFRGLNERMARGIGRMSPGTIPADHQPQLLEQPAEDTADNPAMVRFPFAPDLLATPPFAHGLQ